MEIRTKSDLICMLAKRDHITLLEARHMVNVTQQLINEVIEDEGTLDTIEEILLDDLGIELDYFYLFI